MSKNTTVTKPTCKPRATKPAAATFATGRQVEATFDRGAVADLIARTLQDPATPRSTIDAITRLANGGAAVAGLPVTFTADDPPAFGPFSPEVEKLRGVYEQIGEHLASLTYLQFTTVEGIDISDNRANGEDLKHPLSKAIHRHLYELIFLYCDLPGNPNALRRFYADLRLFGREAEYRMETGHARFKNEEELVKKRRTHKSLKETVDFVQEEIDELEAALKL